MESPNEGKTRGDATRSNEGLALVPFEPLQPTMDGENVVPHEIPQPLEGSPRANPDADREYSCKYCDKKFTNKQALGGHQNAHKVERALEKSAREMHENRFGYGGGSPYLGLGSTPYLGSYNRFYDFMNRSNVNRPSYPSQQPPPMQHGIQFGYNPQPGLSIGGEGNYVPRLFPGFNNMFPGYVGAQPLIPPQFSGQPSYMQHHGLMNRRFSNVGEGSSSARPNVSRGLLTNFMGSSPRASGNRGGGINDQRNDPRDQEQVGDSDLDLSLKL